jgi:nucleoid-associated protein YgaU
MTDVEKYGLFAVVLVGGLLLVVALQGGFSGGEPKAVAEDVLPVVMEAPRHVADAAKGGAGKVVRVKSILPDKPFQWDEAPAPYPGERSSSAPATVKPIGASGSAGLAATAGTHTVAAGETLSDIAAKELGSPNQWDEIVKLNPGLNPKKLQIGQVLRVTAASPPTAGASAPSAPTSAPPLKVAEPQAPVAKAEKAADKPADKPAARPADAAPSTPKVRTHTVVAGDTLSSIAKQYLGSATRAEDIYAVNRDVLKSKDALKLGQVLKIP